MELEHNIEVPYNALHQNDIPENPSFHSLLSVMHHQWKPSLDEADQVHLLLRTLGNPKYDQE